MALHTAAREGSVKELKALIQSGSKIDEKDKHSRTPLHMASWAGHVGSTCAENWCFKKPRQTQAPVRTLTSLLESQVECVTALIEAGANIHSAAMDDMSSLHFAAQQGHLEVCRELLNAGKQCLHAYICSHSLMLHAHDWILQLLCCCAQV